MNRSHGQECRSSSPGWFRLWMPIALLSTVMNNTPLCALAIPLVSGLAERSDQNASRYMMVGVSISPDREQIYDGRNLWMPIALLSTVMIRVDDLGVVRLGHSPR